jgi:hypothetical protein
MYQTPLVEANQLDGETIKRQGIEDQAAATVLRDPAQPESMVGHAPL